jgi:hypothetical protein
MPQSPRQPDVKQQIRDLAKKHRVSYEGGPRDELAQAITALAGDDVQLDETELLLVALQRAGVISGREATLMQADYLRSLRRP